LLFFLCACSGNKTEQETHQRTQTDFQDEVQEVRIQRLDYSDFSYELISNGTIASMRKAELRFQSQEIVRKIHVRNGQFVEAGQPIF